MLVVSQKKKKKTTWHQTCAECPSCNRLSPIALSISDPICITRSHISLESTDSALVYSGLPGYVIGLKHMSGLVSTGDWSAPPLPVLANSGPINWKCQVCQVLLVMHSFPLPAIITLCLNVLNDFPPYLPYRIPSIVLIHSQISLKIWNKITIKLNGHLSFPVRFQNSHADLQQSGRPMLMSTQSQQRCSHLQRPRQSATSKPNDGSWHQFVVGFQGYNDVVVMWFALGFSPFLSQNNTTYFAYGFA